jgi:hypothetical protein
MPGNSLRITEKGTVYPTGKVQILDGATAIWTYSIPAGAHGSVGGITLPTMTVGTHNLSVSYSGDANYPAGVSAASTINVVASEASLTGTCVSTKLTQGQSLSCTVKGMEGSTPLAGVVSYTVNGGTGTMTFDSTGHASIVVPAPATGSGHLSVKYAAQSSHPACPYTLALPFTVN